MNTNKVILGLVIVLFLIVIGLASLTDPYQEWKGIVWVVYPVLGILLIVLGLKRIWDNW